MTMVLVPIPPDRVPEMWHVIAPYTERMTERFPDDWPPGEVGRQALDAKLRLWVVWEKDERKTYGVVGTELSSKPSGKKFLTIVLAAGDDHKRWVNCIGQLEDDARQLGCHGVKILGREGWAKSLPGYSVTREATLSKELI